MAAESREQVTELLQRAASDTAARDRLIAAVYDEMRRLARRILAGDRQRFAVAPTELVHGAAMKLIAQDRITARDRAHFLAYSGQVMRQVLIDHVRHERAAKRDGGTQVTLLSSMADELPAAEIDIEPLHDALEALAAVSPAYASLVERRYFGGLTIEEIAEMDGSSTATVKRQWRAARAWLQDRLSRG